MLASTANVLQQLCAQHARPYTAKPSASPMPRSSNRSTFAVTAPEARLWDCCVACSQPTILLAQHFLGICRYRGPIAVGELMHFFDATHESINDPARVSRLESASSSRPTKRNKSEAAMPPVSPIAATAGTQRQTAQQDQVWAYSASKCHVSHERCMMPLLLLDMCDSDISHYWNSYWEKLKHWQNCCRLRSWLLWSRWMASKCISGCSERLCSRNFSMHTQGKHQHWQKISLLNLCLKCAPWASVCTGLRPRGRRCDSCSFPSGRGLSSTLPSHLACLYEACCWRIILQQSCR